MGESQNIYDNPEFFAGYKQLREQANSYNNLIEQPAIRRLLPDVTGRAVLDLGCGYGDNCADFIRRGAARVVGVDLSEKMLEHARGANAAPGIEYRRLDLNELHALSGEFDLAFSSLAFHYVEDIARLLANIHRLLRGGGRLIFSQEHPLTTAPRRGPEWLNEEDPERICYPLTDYLRPGERSVTWFIDGVRKFHRPFAEIINALIRSGFAIEQIEEPLPDEHALRLNPAMAKERHKPSFLLVKAVKRR